MCCLVLHQLDGKKDSDPGNSIMEIVEPEGRERLGPRLEVWGVAACQSAAQSSDCGFTLHLWHMAIFLF